MLLQKNPENYSGFFVVVLRTSQNRNSQIVNRKF